MRLRMGWESEMSQSKVSEKLSPMVQSIVLILMYLTVILMLVLLSAFLAWCIVFVAISGNELIQGVCL